MTQPSQMLRPVPAAGLAHDAPPTHCRAACDLPGNSPLAPAHARQFTRDELATWQMPAGTVDSAEIIVSELTTNAIRHGGNGPLTVDLYRDGIRLLITVTDRGRPSGPPIQAVEPDPDAESGRGILLVKSLAADWSYYYTPTGTAVWAQLDTPPTLAGPRLLTDGDNRCHANS